MIANLFVAAIFCGISVEAQISFTGLINRGSGLQANGIVQIINLNNKITTIGKINTDGTFLVDSTTTGRFYIYAIPDPKSGSSYLPTYYLEYLKMSDANVIPSSGNVSGIEINLIPRTVSENGSALLEGRFSYADYRSDENTELDRNWLDNAYTPTSPINIFQPPCKNMAVLLYNSSNQVVAHTVTDLQGYYAFKNLTGGNYRIEGQRYSYPTEFGGYINVASSGTTQTKLRMGNQVVTGFAESGMSKEQLISYPNPFQSKLNINLYNAKLTITDLVGNVYLENASFEGGEIQTENWPKGIYLVKCAGLVSKIVKN